MYTLGENALCKIRRLCRSFNLSEKVCQKGCQEFRLASQEWFGLPIKEDPYWPSDISDDGTPYELSLSFNNDETRLRFLVEPSEYEGICEELPFRMSREMLDFSSNYVNFGQDKRFHFWLACDMSEDDTLYKVYMNPKCAIGEIKHAEKLKGEIAYVSRDVLPNGKAREKIYFTCNNEDLSAVSGWPAKTLQKFIQIHAIPENSPRKILVCYAYREGSENPEVTLHFPVRFSGKSDEQICRDIEELSGYQILPGMSHYSPISLANSRGLFSYVSWRLCGENIRLTIYISAQTYSLREVKFARCIEKIETYGKDFIELPLLRGLVEKKYQQEQLINIAQKLAFHVLTFQDIIRIIAKNCRIKTLHKYVTYHCLEDKGHHLWFLQDIETLTGNSLHVGELFSDKTATMRDFSYRLISLLLGGNSPMRGPTMSFMLEELAGNFFPLIAAAFNNPKLNYFGQTHISAEQSHEIFQEEATDAFNNYPLTLNEYDELEDMLGEIFDIMTAMTREVELF